MSEATKGIWLSKPDSQGYWWHWDGNPDLAPFIYGVLVSLTGEVHRYFIQYPDSRWCDEIGGFWMKIEQPSLPTKEKR